MGMNMMSWITEKLVGLVYLTYPKYYHAKAEKPRCFISIVSKLVDYGNYGTQCYLKKI